MTIKENIEYYEKLHQLQMIDAILDEISTYVSNMVNRIEENLEDYDEFTDCNYVAENIIKNIKADLVTLNKYLTTKSTTESYENLFKNVRYKG